MKRSLIRFVAFATPAIGVLIVAVAFGQKGAEPVLNTGKPPIGAAHNSAMTQVGSEIVTVSKDGDAVWLYSSQTGHWHKQSIPADQGPISPTVGRGVVAFRTRSMMYACSSLTGAWDSVEIGDLKAQPTVGFNIAAFRAGNTIYAFSPETGAWDSADVGQDVVGNPNVGSNCAVLETGSKIYAFSGKRGKWAMVDRDNPKSH